MDIQVLGDRYELLELIGEGGMLWSIKPDAESWTG